MLSILHSSIVVADLQLVEEHALLLDAMMWLKAIPRLLLLQSMLLQPERALLLQDLDLLRLVADLLTCILMLPELLHTARMVLVLWLACTVLDSLLPQERDLRALPDLVIPVHPTVATAHRGDQLKVVQIEAIDHIRDDNYTKDSLIN